MKISLALVLIGLTTQVLSSELDQKLKHYIKQFNFEAVEAAPHRDENLFLLGRELFFERQLSGNNNISCHDCHLPRLGTGDNLPFSIGTGGVGLGELRQQATAGVTARNAPPLFNKGSQDFKHLFHDGRVSYNSKTKTFTTPEKGLNGLFPKYRLIAKNLSGALAAQAIFPLVDPLEMLGSELAHLTRIQAWTLLVNKLLDQPKYLELFKKAYPALCKKNCAKFRAKINIAHVGNALAHFQTVAFHVNDTPWDDYLRGKLNALSEEEKRGAIIFSDKAKCTNCHIGKHLKDDGFDNVLVPKVATSRSIDLGLYHLKAKASNLFAFATPALRNISLTGPYFHNGSFQTLEQVVEHYNDPVRSLLTYSLTEQMSDYSYNYQATPIIDQNKPETLMLLLNSVSADLELKLHLSSQEKADLVAFLKHSLTSKRWRRD
jgi:cytochrome c peroxidase